MLRGRGVEDLELAWSSGFLDSEIESGRVISTSRVREVQDPGRSIAPEADQIIRSLAHELGEVWNGETLVVRHERLPVISYPYEWTFSMLKDAALLQLDLTLSALEHGLSVKDATPYNVQFRGAQPVFIDVGSFEKLQPSTPWYGYRQFCEMYLNPLLLQSLRDVAFQPWLRGSMSGIDPSSLASLLRFRDRFHKGVMTHVLLHARSERRLADTDRDIRGELRKAGYSNNMMRAQLQGLRKVVESLKWRRAESTWSSYSERAHYNDEDLELKERLVGEVVGARKRDLVWDLGANDGRFSYIAAEHSETVIAVDADPLVIDHLYTELRRRDENRIVPLTMDLIDSSPSQGWRGTERSGFFTRTKPDVVLALALVHHMVLPGNVPAAEVVAWLAGLSTEVVLEIPHENDPMVKRLLRAKREDLRDIYSLAEFDRRIDEAFDVRRREVLPSGTRTLLHLTPRD